MFVFQQNLLSPVSIVEGTTQTFRSTTVKVQQLKQAAVLCALLTLISTATLARGIPNMYTVTFSSGEAIRKVFINLSNNIHTCTCVLTFVITQCIATDIESSSRVCVCIFILNRNFNRDSSVGTVTKLWIERLISRGSIPSGRDRLFSSPLPFIWGSLNLLHNTCHGLFLAGGTA